MDKLDTLQKAYRITVFMGAPMVVSLLLYWVCMQFILAPTILYPEVIIPVRYALYFIATANLVAIVLLNRIFLKKSPEDNLSTLIAKLKLSSVVTFALCEAPAIFGLVLYFIGASRSDFYILTVYSLLLFAIFFPRWNKWQEYTASAGL